MIYPPIYNKMKRVYLLDLIHGETYYIQTKHYKFKAVYDRFEKNRFYFKKIIRLNTPMDFQGYIDIYQYMHFKLYEEEKTKIQTAMETRAIKLILMEITGTEIY